MLANQFVSGLRPELKSRIVGLEGNLETLLTRARFEEAKLRDLPQPTSKTATNPRDRGREKQNNQRGVKAGTLPNSRDRGSEPVGGTSPQIKCNNCGGGGHLARNCPKPRQSGSEEARGMRPQQQFRPQKGRHVAAVVSEEDSLAPARDKETEGDDSSQPDTAVQKALEQATAVMRGRSSA